MRREERTSIDRDALPSGGIAKSRDPIGGYARKVPPRLWRDVMSRWIGTSQDDSPASLTRGGLEAPPVRVRQGALNFPQSGHITAAGISGGANVTDCTTGGETCAPMS
jgi:hypothetical protein